MKLQANSHGILVVTNIVTTEVVGDWNDQCLATFPRDQVQIGDCIISVNGRDANFHHEFTNERVREFFMVMCRHVLAGPP
eukprot:10035048-Heterocapsa_arctica.AAC.1